MTKAAELAKMGEVLTNSQIGGRRNIIINGAMQVAQRGTSIAVSSTLVYTLDRFAAENDTTTMTATQASDAPTGFEYSLKLTNGTGATATGTHINRLVTKLEGYDTNHLEIGTANEKKVWDLLQTTTKPFPPYKSLRYFLNKVKRRKANWNDPRS